MAPLMKLDNPTHSKTHLTTKNASEMFLWFPLEVRLMIYEYAVKINEPIEPTILDKHSNKFRWHSEEPLLVSYIQQWLPMPTRAPLVVSQLGQTCRQIYHEIESYPMFYRVNTFRFRTSESMLKFLVAITPQRRAMIRRILYEDGYDLTNGWKGSNIHVMPLLLQCKDLRQFKITLRLHFYHPRYILEKGVEVLKSILAGANSSDDDLSLWNLPCIHPIFEDRGNRFLPVKTTVIDLGDPNPVDPAYCPSSWVHQKRAADLITKLKYVIHQRRKRLFKADKLGQGLRAKITNTQASEAIVAARIDLPGEDRINQDRFNSTFGTISTRTRLQCRNIVDDRTGNFDRGSTKPEKYDLEGHLTGFPFRVEEVRWKESTIKCMVKHFHLPQTPEAIDLSWEELDTLATADGIYELCRYYTTISLQRYWADPYFRLQEVELIPPPKEITRVLDDFVSHWRRDKPRSWKAYVRHWATRQHKFEGMVRRLKAAIKAVEQETYEDDN